MISIPIKFKSKFTQQYHRLHTLPNFISHQHCPSFIPNISTIKKWPKTKKTTWSHNDFQPNHTMLNIPIRTNNNKMTMSYHQALNKTWNQQICQQRNKNELTLKSFLECEALVLGSWRSPSSSFHSRDGWYFFPLKVRKDGPLEDAMKVQKMEVWRWVSRKGVCYEVGQEHKDLKWYWGKWMKASLEA